MLPNAGSTLATVRRIRVEGHESQRLAVVAVPGPDGAPIPVDPDAGDCWFQAELPAFAAFPGDEIVLRFDGLATLAEVWLDDEPILHSESMYLAHEVVVGDRARPGGRLVIRCRALGPELAAPRRPRARWRTRIVRDNGLRWFRTSILGRAPGFAPGPPVVGPWQPIWLEIRRRIVIEQLRVRTYLHGDTGVLRVFASIRTLEPVEVSRVRVVVDGPSGRHEADLELAGDGTLAHGELRLEDVARWWPHTHGLPTVHAVTLQVALSDGAVIEVDAGRVGFRTVAAGPGPVHDLAADGLDLHVNGVQVFARGAVWTPLPDGDPAGWTAALDATLAAVCEAGMNMVRVPGIGRYESDAFHDRCDALGIMVWQDAAFANLDYPFGDPVFAASCRAELEQLMDRIGGRPSTVVVCGNSEIEQQVAMLGLPSDAWRDPFFAETLPAVVATAESDAIVVPSAPFGGDRPFVTDRGIANYYGVGGYRRPRSDARRAAVRFAAECLAFANVPDDSTIARMLPDAPRDVVVHHPVWKAAVPRDNGSGWDFEDVRDHYLAETGVDPAALRSADHARYLDRSRAITGELMAELFGEWRRPGSPCGGGLVLWLRDLAPGAGWGVLDDLGAAKVAYHHLRRALAPIAVWLTDEGSNGVAIHVANDRPVTLDASLRIACYRDGELPVASATIDLDVEAHAAITLDAETLVGRFIDASYAYRFGPPGHDLIVASLERAVPDGPELLSQSFLFPVGRPRRLESADGLGLRGCAEGTADGGLDVVIRTRRVVDGVRLLVPGFVASDDAFAVEPGGARRVRLHPVPVAARTEASSSGAIGWMTALNVDGRVPIRLGPA